MAKSLKVLIAEDNPTNLLVLSTMLSMLGCEATVAEDGVEAVEAAVRDQPNLVLMDISMPRMNGMEATREILAKLKDSGVKVVAVTANVTDAQRRACEQAGFAAFLDKPVSLEKLEAVLAAA
jgi:CheY-like chemotaxis protein